MKHAYSTKFKITLQKLNIIDLIVILVLIFSLIHRNGLLILNNLVLVLHSKFLFKIGDLAYFKGLIA